MYELQRALKGARACRSNFCCRRFSRRETDQFLERRSRSRVRGHANFVGKLRRSFPLLSRLPIPIPLNRRDTAEFVVTIARNRVDYRKIKNFFLL